MKKRIFLLLICTSALSLITSCRKEMPPIADFTSVISDLTVTFTSTSSNSPIELTWDFGDGTTGTGSPVTHTYSKDSSYTVKLTATNKDGTNSVSKLVVVEKKEKVIEIKTSFGSMYMWLFNETPKHKLNFLHLAETNYLDGTTFHRIIDGFMIQGGDPNSKDSDPTNDGFGGPGYTIDAEILPAFKHDYGAVGAARDNNPQKASSGSQFYIVENKTGAHHLDGNYTVFGHIMKGMNVVETIAIQPKDPNNDRPLTDIKMEVKELLKTKAEIKNEYGYTIP